MKEHLPFDQLSKLTTRLAAKFNGSPTPVPYVLGFSSEEMSTRKRKRMCTYFLEEAHADRLLLNWSGSDYNNYEFHQFLLSYLKRAIGKHKSKTPTRQFLEQIAPYLNIIYKFDGVYCDTGGPFDIVVIRKNGIEKAFSFPAGTVRFTT
ncbi:hypothetical protein HN958_03060 [Candidatus Falkowbacteria bacterium]|jgi:hypothetical protein|nr:hypothetical protein [Candidatus Falkowbacteria bacterium]MBT7007458.1 hypothetical protein [Candidatus Falkowbacteria bacterium]